MLALAIHPTSLFVTEQNVFVLLLLLIWGMGTCLLGYPLFRLTVAGYGVMLGLAGGWDLVHLLRQTPSTGDYLVGMLAGAAALGALAWITDRAAFAMTVVWTVASLIASLFAHSAWRVGWLAGALLGIGFGTLAWHYARRTAIALSATVGAVLAVYAMALLIVGGRTGQALVTATFGPDGRPWIGVLLVLIVAALAGAGMSLQSKLADAVGDTFMPTSGPGARRGRRRTAEVRPRFTKI